MNHRAPTRCIECGWPLSQRCEHTIEQQLGVPNPGAVVDCPLCGQGSISAYALSHHYRHDCPHFARHLRSND